MTLSAEMKSLNLKYEVKANCKNKLISGNLEPEKDNRKGK